MDPIKLELRLHKNEIYFPSTDDFKLINKIENSIIYYNTELYTYNNVEYDSISYMINYIYNGAIGCGNCCFPASKKLGFHNIDRERIKILIDKETGEPKYVYFSAHASEGKWYSYDKCEKNKDGNLIIYSALDSHANYPHSGRWLRIFGFANDKCSSKGEHIVPELILLPTYSYNPQNKDNNTFKFRFCLPCYM